MLRLKLFFKEIAMERNFLIVLHLGVLDCVRFCPPLPWGLNIAAARVACTVFMLLFCGVCCGQYSGGSGTAGDPYRISTDGID